MIDPSSIIIDSGLLKLITDWQTVEMEQRLEKLPPVSMQLLVLARERGRLTIAEAVTLLAVNRNTAKLHIRQLVAKGCLVQHGTGKATWYTVGR